MNDVAGLHRCLMRVCRRVISRAKPIAADRKRKNVEQKDVHHRDAEYAELGIFFERKLFTPRPLRT